MKYVFFGLVLILAYGCSNRNSTPKEPMNKARHEVSGDTNCVKCDKKLISRLEIVQHSSYTTEDIRKLLCSFDSSCEFSEIYYPEPFEYVDVLGDTLIGQAEPISYHELAREMLILGFYENFSTYMIQFESNPNLNLNYIIKLMVYESKQDLPFAHILDSLRNYSKDSEVKRELIDVFQGNIDKFNK